MPLRAYINNEEIISIDLDDEQWKELKNRIISNEVTLTLPCCDQVGFLRKSKKGLKHFVHKTSQKNCDRKPESPEHLKSKIEIVKACKENGWMAIPEFSENDWRADVLAVQDGKRIAFEVQWSKQTFEETRFRQKRYKDSNVRGCWFFRSPPKELMDYDENLKADKEIPAFKIFKDKNLNIIAKLNNLEIPLKNLVDCLLKGKLKFCEHKKLKPKQEVTIIFFETKCWKCKKIQHLWTVEQNFVTVCNLKYFFDISMWDNEDIDKHPKIYEAVMKFLTNEKGKHLKIGQLKKRYSNTVKKSYLSFGCYWCDAIFGDWFLNQEKVYIENDSKSIKHKVEIEFETIKVKEPHWCFSENGEFCE